jgi:hypothetical protein
VPPLGPFCCVTYPAVRDVVAVTRRRLKSARRRKEAAGVRLFLRPCCSRDTALDHRSRHDPTRVKEAMMDRVEAGFLVTAITGGMVLVASILWLALL